MPTLVEARDAVQAGFLASWAPATETLLGEPARVFWQADQPNQDERPEPDEVFARFTIRHSSGAQRTLAEVGARRFTQRGFIFLEVFTPLSLNSEEAAQVADAGLKTLLGKEYGGVWIRNARAIERQPEKHWFSWLITAEFEYDEVA